MRTRPVHNMSFIESRWFRSLVSTLICVNAIVLGAQTIDGLSPSWRMVLGCIDSGCLAFFMLEMVLKIRVYRAAFLKDGWNLFDFLVILIALVPQLGVFTTLRIFRSLRILRVVSGTRNLRAIVTSIVNALPGVAWTSFLLGLIYYVYAILGVTMFSKECPALFGSIGRACLTLFQMMTLDNWCSDVAAPLIEAHPLSWIYFVSFVLVSAFVIMNVVVGIFVSTMSEARNEIRGREEWVSTIEDEVRCLGKKIDHLEESCQKKVSEGIL